MARDYFQIEVQDAELIAALNRAIAKLENPKELMDSIGALIEGKVRQRFIDKVDPLGVLWASRSPNTLARYEWEKKKYGTPIGTLLDRTTHMLGTLTHNAGSDYAEIGFSALVDNGKWQKADLHEFGTKHMPRRGMLMANPEEGTLGEQDRADVVELVDRFLLDLLD